MNAEIIRLKLANWYDAFLLKIFLAIRDAPFPLRRGIRAGWKEGQGYPFRGQSARTQHQYKNLCSAPRRFVVIGDLPLILSQQ